MKKNLILFVVLLIFSTFSFGQKYLQIEHRNRMKVKRYMAGEVITFKLKGKNQDWRKEELLKIIPNENILLFDNGMVQASDIAAFKKEYGFTKTIARQFYRFGIAWAGYGLIGDALGESDFGKSDLIIIGTSVATGFLLSKTFRSRKIRFNERRRIRLIDLSFRNEK